MSTYKTTNLRGASPGRLWWPKTKESQNVYIIPCWLDTFVVCYNGLQCGLGTYHRFRKNGRPRCKICPPCNGGEGWNMSVVVVVDADRVYMECYPCVKCQEGYYRPTHSVSHACYKCQLDCRLLNRYGSISCGSDTPGHCGECMFGFKAESSEANDICLKKDVSEETTSPKEQTSFRQHTVLPMDTAQIVLVLFAAMLVVVVAILTVNICRLYKRYETAEEGLLPAGNCSPVSKSELDTDGPHPVLERTELLSRVNVVGKLYSKIYPGEELWERGKMSFVNYIFNVLVEWTKSAQPYPNLVWLCDALEIANFHEVIEQILVLKENQMTERFPN